VHHQIVFDFSLLLFVFVSFKLFLGGSSRFTGVFSLFRDYHKLHRTPNPLGTCKVCRCIFCCCYFVYLLSLFLSLQFARISFFFHSSPFSLFSDQLFNVFHPLDPVSFRVEPLMFENYDSSPAPLIHHDFADGDDVTVKIQQLKAMVHAGKTAVLHSNCDLLCSSGGCLMHASCHCAYQCIA
jgi:hypothetical protein